MNDVIIHSTKILNKLPEIYFSLDAFEIVLQIESDDMNAHMSFEFYPKGNEYQLAFQSDIIYDGKFQRYIDIASIKYIWEKKASKLHIKGKFIDYYPERSIQ